MSHLHSENTSFHHIFIKNIQKKEISIQTTTQSHTSPNAKSRKIHPGMIFMHYTPIPTLSYPIPIQVFISTYTHHPIPQSPPPSLILTLVLILGSAPPSRSSLTTSACPLFAAPLIGDLPSYVYEYTQRQEKGRDRWREEGERRGRDASGMCE